MTDTGDDSRRDVALFRCGLIADLPLLPAGSRETAAGLRDRAARDHAIPGTRRARVGERTMRDWMRLYRSGGFDALLPKRRRDGGRPRRKAYLVAFIDDCSRVVPHAAFAFSGNTAASSSSAASACSRGRSDAERPPPAGTWSRRCIPGSTGSATWR